MIMVKKNPQTSIVTKLNFQHLIVRLGESRCTSVNILLGSKRAGAITTAARVRWLFLRGRGKNLLVSQGGIRLREGERRNINTLWTETDGLSYVVRQRSHPSGEGSL